MLNPVTREAGELHVCGSHMKYEPCINKVILFMLQRLPLRLDYILSYLLTASLKESRPPYSR